MTAKIAKDTIINEGLVKDDPTSKILSNIRTYLRDSLLPNFRGSFYTFSILKNGTFVLPHNLGFRPYDVIQTSNTGGVVAWHYDNFDKTNVEFVVAGVVTGTPCVVRAFIGTYGGN